MGLHNSEQFIYLCLWWKCRWQNLQGSSVRRGLLGVFLSLGFPRVFLLGEWRCGCVTKRNNVSGSQNSCAHCEIPLLLSRVGQPGDALRILKATHYRENVFIFQLSTKETPLILLHCRGFPAPQDNKNYIFHVPLQLFSQSFIYKNLSCVKCTFSPVWLKKL